jgi:hypothetical protein
MIKQVWWNKEELPSSGRPQKTLCIHLPSLLPVLSLPITIGYTGKQEDPHFPYIMTKTFYFIILGFGISYNINWDE